MRSRSHDGILALALALASTGCRDGTGPASEKPPYLAIVTHLNALPGVVPPAAVSYRVRELSGTLGIDRTVSASPSDTIILAVPPATYVVDMQDVPTTCFVREGAQRGIVLTEQDNTGLVRYVVQCRGALNIETATDGYDADASFIYRIARDGMTPRAGLVGANDTLVFNDLAPGEYSIRLAGVSPNCVVTSDGGIQQTFQLAETGGTTVRFRVQCSRESERPRLLSLHGSYVFGSSAFVFRVHDPNRDADGYTWDLTDCNGNSILPDRRKRIRRGLSSGRTRLQDTLTVVGAYDIGLPSAEMTGRCVQIRVFDYESNTTGFVEARINTGTGQAPRVASFNAVLVGTQYVQTAHSVIDPDGDFAGIFVAVRLRDGTLGPPDGQPDVGIMDPAGYLTADVPMIPTTGRLSWDSIYSVIVWSIDAQGNAARIEDPDVFR